MKEWLTKLMSWWYQRRLEALYTTLTREGLWGVHVECLTQLDALIRPRLEAHYPGGWLKETKAHLHASSIDLLTSDLYRMAETIHRSDYVDERLSYVTREPRPFYVYLAHRDGHALPVDQAYLIFHRQALDAAEAIDSLSETEDEDIDSRYYLRRYQGILEETLVVYSLFAQLTGLIFPSASEASAQTASRRTATNP